MILDNEDKKSHWGPYIAGMAATAILSALGTKLVEWVIDELRDRYGSKKKSDPKSTTHD